MIQKENLIEVLQNGIKEIGLSLTEAVQINLINYIELLFKWNSIHNLTAIRDPIEMVKRHLLDSLVLLPLLSPSRVVDVGTGAGLPGIPLAICWPEETVVLLDSNQKKMTFVQHVILSLKLKNALAVCTRVEKYQTDTLFKLVLSRAFASLSEFIKLSKHLCEPEGKLIAMKGAIDSAERADIPSGFAIEKIVPVKVPGVMATRTLVFITMN